MAFSFFRLPVRLLPILAACSAALALTACQAAPTGMPAADRATAVSRTASAALSTQAAGATQSADIKITAVPTVSAPAQTAIPAPTSTPGDHTLGIPVYLPQRLRESIELPAGWKGLEDSPSANLRLTVQAGIASDAVPWTYALVAPFPTVADEISLAELRDLWEGKVEEGLPVHTLLVDVPTRAAFEQVWGKSSGETVRAVNEVQLLERAWASKDAWALVPFEKLEPRWKVIAVDGQSPVRKEFAPGQYGLTLSFKLAGNPALRSELLAKGPLAQPNRRPERLSTVMLTGVTALVRGTASLMEGRGLDYPAQDIGPWLREADILHISNEVPFAKNCPPPFDWKDLVFCSRPKYIQLLEDVGADVIELTGDHFQDWGPEATLYTLELYRERGWPYYGGGANIEEARQAVRLEHNGNRIAFLGCNAKAKGYATASETAPGAAHCDFDRLVADIRKLRDEDYLPIVTFQHLEYYSYPANPILQADFRRAAEAGAVIVSGSQAHQPHAFEFTRGSFLHYGLGNLFFDQTNQGDAPRTAFIDRHIFYGGRHISTELLTIYLVDYARSRPMTVEERQQMLQTVFDASDWK